MCVALALLGFPECERPFFVLFESPEDGAVITEAGTVSFVAQVGTTPHATGTEEAMDIELLEIANGELVSHGAQVPSSRTIFTWNATAEDNGNHMFVLRVTDQRNFQYWSSALRVTVDIQGAEASCGDGVCQSSQDEMCTSCPADCDTTEDVCGNGQCQGDETSSTCEADCGPASWPLDWFAWEQELLEEINQHRAAGTDCPETTQSPTHAVTMNDDLQRAAQLHAWDMSHSGYFSHSSCNGRSPWSRASDQGTSAGGEIIGAGYSSPTHMVNGWLNSQGHCAILMGSRYDEMGAGYAADSGRYWVGMFR